MTLKTQLADAESTAPEAETVTGAVKRVLFRPGWATFPAALFELVAAAVVVNHAATAPDMAAVVWASGFVLALYFTWVFHHAAVLRRRVFQNLILVIKTGLGGLMAVVLWERSDPHTVWTGAGFTMSEQSWGLVTASVFLGLSLLLLVFFRAFRVLVALVQLWRLRSV